VVARWASFAAVADGGFAAAAEGVAAKLADMDLANLGQNLEAEDQRCSE